MRKSAIEDLFIVILGVLAAMAIATAGGVSYLKWANT